MRKSINIYVYLQVDFYFEIWSVLIQFLVSGDKIAKLSYLNIQSLNEIMTISTNNIWRLCLPRRRNHLYVKIATKINRYLFIYNNVIIKCYYGENLVINLITNENAFLILSHHNHHNTYVLVVIIIDTNPRIKYKLHFISSCVFTSLPSFRIIDDN